MLFRLFLAFWNFWLALTKYRLGLKEGSPELYYCGKSFYKTTYRFPEKSIRDPFITFRLYKRIFTSVFKKKKAYVYYVNNTGSAILDENMSGTKLRFDYIGKFTGEKSDLFVSKNDLLCYSGIFGTILTLLTLLISFLPILFLSLFSRNKLHYPLIISECLECFYLLNLLSKYSIKKIHYFCIYERDANICALILMKQNVFVNKIPSEVPLHFFNQIIVADELSFCFAYQKEEFEEFKKTMFVQKTSLWGPEQILNAPKHLFSSKDEREFAFDIGFYSSGNWMREIMGDVNLGHNDKENEELLLKTLITYTNLYDLKLCIFLHPTEKRKENLKKTEDYYFGTLSENTRVTIAPIDKPSIESFDDVDLAISLYSTLMFERIFMGFKTLIAPFDYKDFPIKTSSFNNICADGVNDLCRKITFNLPLSKSDFFIKNNLKDYTYLALGNKLIELSS